MIAAASLLVAAGLQTKSLKGVESKPFPIWSSSLPQRLTPIGSRLQSRVAVIGVIAPTVSG
jgi:hypothetical protein